MRRVMPCLVLINFALAGCGCATSYSPEFWGTPLHWAADERGPSQIENQLQAGIPINVRDDHGNTPLILASGWGGSTKNVQSLLKAGADINAQNNTGETALMKAASAEWMHAHGAFRPHEEVINRTRALLQAGAALEIADQNGATALMHSASRGDTALMQLLIDAGANIEAKDNDGLTPLMHAARDCGWSRLPIECLVRAGANVEALDNQGRTALMWHARSGLEQDEHRPALLKAGANIEVQDHAGWTPVMHAAHEASTNAAVKKLLEAGASPAPARWSKLTVSILREDREDFERELRSGASLESRDVWNRTPLMWASRFITLEQPHWAQELINAGADVHAQDDTGKSALMLATHQAWLGEMQILLNAGADVNAADENGQTALMIAAETIGSEYKVELLLAHHASVNKRDATGRTALMLAASDASEIKVIGLLFDAGADIAAADHQGFTAVDYARRAEVADWIVNALQDPAEMRKWREKRK